MWIFRERMSRTKPFNGTLKDLAWMKLENSLSVNVFKMASIFPMRNPTKIISEWFPSAKAVDWKKMRLLFWISRYCYLPFQWFLEVLLSKWSCEDCVGHPTQSGLRGNVEELVNCSDTPYSRCNGSICSFCFGKEVLAIQGEAARSDFSGHFRQEYSVCVFV